MVIDRTCKLKTFIKQSNAVFKAFEGRLGRWGTDIDFVSIILGDSDNYFTIISRREILAQICYA